MSPLRVLIADDDHNVRRQLVGLVEDEGHAVVADVSDGASAVTEALLLRPDVALLDLRMPRLDGIEAARAIHAAAPTILLILLTAYDDDSLRASALASGAGSYLVKGGPACEILDAILEADAVSRPLGERHAAS